MTGRDAGISWRVLRLAREEPGQVLRLQAFRTAHPHVIIGDAGFGVWQARIPEQDGERIISRYMLRELLDKLDEIAGEPGSQADSRLRINGQGALADAGNVLVVARGDFGDYGT